MAKFVSYIKYDKMGDLHLRDKARRVARGSIQIYGVNYEKSFAPAIHNDTFRLLITLAIVNRFK